MPRKSYSVRSRLVLLALLPLLILLPLLLLLIQTWGSSYYNRLLTFKVSSDLAVAHEYFYHTVERIGSEVVALADTHALLDALPRQPIRDEFLASRQAQLGLDFLYFLPPEPAPGEPKTRGWPVVRSAFDGTGHTAIDVFSAEQIRAINPVLSKIAEVEHMAPNGKPAGTGIETRGLFIHAAAPVYDRSGRLLGVLEGGMMLNRNLNFVDTINALVYPSDSLPLGSHGTATLFLDDVRIATNVRLFGERRALGTRPSAEVREHVLQGGQTWLDRAFVVYDWYISAYEPIHDSYNKTVGMLYVGYLETPFQRAKQQAVWLVVGLFLLVCAICVYLSLRVSRTIYRPIEAIEHTMEAVEAGSTAARTGNPQGARELNRLALNLDQLLDTVQHQNAELKAWADSLDLKVKARTAELEDANLRLQKAQRQLALTEKLASIGEITAGVAHEINNPVAVLQGNLDVVREVLGPDAERLQNELALMDQQLYRINIIVTKLLQFASPTEYAGYIEHIEMTTIVTDALLLTRHLLQRANIAVEQAHAPQASVSANRNELQQVLINLISNAVHAMPEGGMLRIRSHNQASPAGTAGVAVEVEDTGCGIAAENLPHVFDAFFTTRPGKGTGLGLSISYTLIARYKGDISVHSTPGEGTRFTVWLPAAD